MSAALPPYRINAQLSAAALAFGVIQLFAVPLVLLPGADVLAIAVVLLLSFTTPFHRALLHEAIHGRLVGRKGWNDRLGRALAIWSGIAFDAIRFGHLAHHRFPRHALDRADVIEPGKNPIAARFNYFLGLFGGLYLREILGTVFMLLPRRAITGMLDYSFAAEEPTNAVLRDAFQRNLGRRIARIRIDAVLIILIHAAAFYLYGEWWPLLLTAITLRGLIVSLQDNVPHYGTPAVIGAPAHNSSAPRWVGLLMLNLNLHGVHHDRPELPWNVLPGAFEGAGRGYAGSYVALLLKQLRGPRRSGAIARP